MFVPVPVSTNVAVTPVFAALIALTTPAGVSVATLIVVVVGALTAVTPVVVALTV